MEVTSSLRRDKFKTIGMAVVALSIYLGIVVGLLAIITVFWAAGIYGASGLLSLLGIAGSGPLPFFWCLVIATPIAVLFGWRVTG